MSAHTPGPRGFIPSMGDVTAVPYCNDNGKVLHYEVTVYDLGGGDCFQTNGLTAEDAERQARNVIRACDDRAELLAALRECETRLSRIACGELSGMAAKHSAKSGLETVGAAIAKAEGRT